MRIEINAGGIGGISVLDYQTHMQSYVSDADSVISSFKAVKSNTYNLNGGVGNLQGALDSISARVQQEETKKTAATQVQTKANDFLSLVARVDKQVAVDVEQNKDEFYRTNSWLKPVSSTDETAWYEDAWNWLCDTKDAVVEGAKAIWTGIKDTVKKAWDGLVTFYNEHKKIIDTILIVVGAIGAIAAVIATGGLALVPLLGALGLSASAAVAISTAVAVIAVVSTVASSTLNVVDTWAEIDNPTFNAWQTGLNITATISNLTYSIGNIYNSIKGVTPQEYIARQNAIENGKLGYDNLTSTHPNIKTEPGRDFSATQKNAIYEENARRNGGVIRDDISGKELTRYKSKAGISKPLNGAEIDHVFPKSLGGDNSFANARIINWKTNLIKSNDLTFDLNTTIGGIEDVANIPDIIRYGIEGNFGIVTHHMQTE